MHRRPRSATVGCQSSTTGTIFDFTWEWLDYINPLIFLWDPGKLTLSVGLRLFFSQYDAEWALLMAVATMFTLPMFVIFFFAQHTSPDLASVFTHPVVA